MWEITAWKTKTQVKEISHHPSLGNEICYVPSLSLPRHEQEKKHLSFFSNFIEQQKSPAMLFNIQNVREARKTIYSNAWIDLLKFKRQWIHRFFFYIAMCVAFFFHPFCVYLFSGFLSNRKENLHLHMSEGESWDWRWHTKHRARVFGYYINNNAINSRKYSYFVRLEK